jgi:uncharacterized phage-associated protein
MFKRNGHDAIAVANELLRIARARGRELTIMQLLKLVYFAHGWSLATLRSPLIRDEVQAWMYGPVIPTVYSAFVHTRGAAIMAPGCDRLTGIVPRASFSEDESTLLNDVFEGYGHLHAFQLSDLTHQSGTPWSQTFNSRGAYAQIPDKMMEAYFTELSVEAEAEKERA